MPNTLIYVRDLLLKRMRTFDLHMSLHVATIMLPFIFRKKAMHGISNHIARNLRKFKAEIQN
jgi:hypothetical protein